MGKLTSRLKASQIWKFNCHNLRTRSKFYKKYVKNILLTTLILSILFITLRHYNRAISVRFTNNNPTGDNLIVDWGPYFEDAEYGSSKSLQIGKCLLTKDKSMLLKAQAVLVPIRILIHGYDFPHQRPAGQQWVFLLDESPTFTKIQQWFDLSQLGGMFNMTMTYRRDSDIPIPYGWTSQSKHVNHMSGVDSIYNSRQKLVAAAISNCRDFSGRLNYIKLLKKHIQVDVYGQCGTKKCSSKYQSYVERVREECIELRQYKFFLAFENTVCREYITEKFWTRALQGEMIPIVMGGSKEDYEAVAPPNSFIHVDDFESAKDLADYVVSVAQSKEKFSKYHKWRETHNIHVRHQFFNSTYIINKLCDRIMSKVEKPPFAYADLYNWWFYPEVCHEHGWFF